MTTKSRFAEIVSSVELIRKNNNITTDEKRRLCEIHLLCRKNEWIHRKCSIFFYKCNHGLSIPTILVNSIMAVVTQVVPEQTYIFSSIFILNTALELFKKYFLFEKKFQEHVNLSNQFNQLATDVENLIVNPNISPDQYREIGTRYSAMTVMSNIYTPNSISEEAEEKFRRFSDVEKYKEERKEPNDIV